MLLLLLLLCLSFVIFDMFRLFAVTTVFVVAVAWPALCIVAVHLFLLVLLSESQHLNYHQQHSALALFHCFLFTGMPFTAVAKRTNTTAIWPWGQSKFVEFVERVQNKQKKSHNTPTEDKKKNVIK